MKWRETATEVHIFNRVTGIKAPSMFFYGKQEEAIKHAKTHNTLLKRFPEKWMCF